MSERLQSTPETKSEQLDLSAEATKNLERLQEAARKSETTPEQSVETITQQVKEKAVSGREVTIGERETSHQSHTPGLQKELKAESYARALRRIQSNLNPAERNFSKLIHRPAVERISQVAGRTVARPSGVLGGSIVALIGSVLLLFFANQYGFTYNYLFFGVLFVSGFLAGAVIEFAVRLVNRYQ